MLKCLHGHLTRQRLRIRVAYNRLFGRYLAFPHMRGGLLVLITNRVCNLRCRDCGTLTPYLNQASLPGYFDVVKVEQDLRALAKVLRVRTVQLQGGEALLHPQIAQMVRAVADSGIGSRIVLATNATRMLDEKLASVLRDTGALVRISDYGLVSLQKVDELRRQCIALGVRVSRHRMATRADTWFDLGTPGVPRNEDDKATQAIFQRCPYQVCWSLTDGLFSKCSRAPNGAASGTHTHFSQDFVNVRDMPTANQLRQELKQYLFGYGFMEACRYCRGSQGPEVQAGIQLPR